MSSKIKWSFLLILSSSLIFGCDFTPFQNLKIGEGGPKDGEVKLDLGRYSCMTEIGRKFDEYLDGKLDRNQIHLFMECVRTALNRFQFYAKGSSSDSYQPGELSAFLNREFLREKQLTPALIKEIMDLKTIILGGDNTRITKAEFKEIYGFIDFAEEHALKNLKYLKLHNDLDRSNLKISAAELEEAKMQLRISANELALKLREKGRPYSLSSLKKLLVEMRQFLDWDSLNEKHWTVDQIIDLASAVKTIVTGVEGDSIPAKSWTAISDVGVSIYGIFLDYDLFLKKVSITYGEGLEVLISSFSSFFSVLQTCIENNTDGVIVFAKTDHLFDVLVELKIVPEGFRAKSLKDSYNHLIRQAFQNPIGTETTTEVLGLNLRAVNEMRSEFFLWADTQRFLSENAEKHFMAKTGSPLFSMSIGFDRAIKSFDFTQVLSWSKDPRAQEISFLVDNIRPLFHENDERAFVIPKVEIPKFDIKHGIYDLTRLNVMRALVRILIRGFADKQRVITMAGLTEDEMENFYQVARPLGEDLLFMDPRKLEVGKRIYQEANLFTFSGNGVQKPDARNSHLMSFVETTEVVALMWSGGQVRDLLYKNIKAECDKEGIHGGPLDVVKMEKLPRHCFRKYFAKNNFSEFDNLPYYRDFLRNLYHNKKSDYLQFINAMEKIAMIPCERDSKDYIEIAELATIATASHYIEVLFTQYDRDRNGYINGAEVIAAFSRFNVFLGKQIELSTGSYPQVDTIKAVYAYLIKNQRLPQGWDLAGVWWDSVGYSDDPTKLQGNMKDMSIDRLGIVRVLKTLADASPPKMRDPHCVAKAKH